MNKALPVLGQEQYINDMQGKPEFIVLPIKVYQELMECIEDYGLGLAMQEAENSKRYNTEAALKFLDNED